MSSFYHVFLHFGWVAPSPHHWELVRLSVCLLPPLDLCHWWHHPHQNLCKREIQWVCVQSFHNYLKSHDIKKEFIVFRNDHRRIHYHKFWKHTPLWRFWGHCHWIQTSCLRNLQMSCNHHQPMRRLLWSYHWMDSPKKKNSKKIIAQIILVSWNFGIFELN